MCVCQIASLDDRVFFALLIYLFCVAQWMHRTTYKSIILSSRRHVSFCVAVSAHTLEHASIIKRLKRVFRSQFHYRHEVHDEIRRRPATAKVHLADPLTCHGIAQHSEIMMGHVERTACAYNLSGVLNSRIKKERFPPNARNMQILRAHIGDASACLCSTLIALSFYANA